MDFEIWAAFVAASCVVLMVPGPMVLLVVTCAMGQGPRAALPLACGTVLGDATMMTVSVLGAGSLLAAHASLYAALQWAGAAYLAWLGWSFWRAGSVGEPGSEPGSEPRVAGTRLARRAWLAVVLNPMTVMFFVAFLPQFIDPGGRYWVQVAVLEATFLGLAFANTVLYAQCAARVARLLAAPGAVSALQRGGGAMLVGMSLWLLARGA